MEKKTSILNYNRQETLYAYMVQGIIWLKPLSKSLVFSKIHNINSRINKKVIFFTRILNT